MSMNSIKMIKLLEKKLGGESFRTSYDRDKEQFRIEWKETKKGLTIELPRLVAKYNERGEEAIDEIVKDVKEALKLMGEEHTLKGNEKQIYPVIRSTSFPQESNGKKLVTKEHTAETRIYYALDLNSSYRLIDEDMLKEVNLTEESLHEMALFNLRALKHEVKKDSVNDNIFYFVATNDGYDASRILNEAFLEEMKQKCRGDMAVATPHQDVLIIADIVNEVGYDVLGQMTFRFFSEGRVPITALPFIYENNKLEPIFILARNKPSRKKD